MTVTRTQIPKEVDAVYNRELLYRATHNLVHNKWAKSSPIGQNAGSNVMRFRRYANLAPATTPLVEGVTPAGSSLSPTQLTVQVNQYGDYIKYSDRVQYESQDPLLMEFAGILGDQGGETLDVITRDIMHSGTQVVYAGGRISRATVEATDNVAYSDIEKIIEMLKNGKARKITEMVTASGKINTSPVAAAYIGICTPNAGKQLKRLTQFVRVENYSSTMDVLEGEIGKIDDIRFIETTNGKVFEAAGAASGDVHSIVVFGKEAYGTTKVEGQSMRMITKPLGSAGTEDPLEQRGTSGWKATHAAVILNNAFMVRYEVGKAN